MAANCTGRRAKLCQMAPGIATFPAIPSDLKDLLAPGFASAGRNMSSQAIARKAARRAAQARWNNRCSIHSRSALASAAKANSTTATVIISSFCTS